MTDVSEIFSRDPTSCSRDDIAQLVIAFRERRKQFLIGNATAGRTKPPTAKAQQSVQAAGKLDLKKFGL